MSVRRLPTVRWLAVSTGIAFSVLLLVTGAPAEAQNDTGPSDDERARAAFEAGRDALRTGDYEEALAQFELAHTLSERPELLFNIGIAHDRLRHDAEAIAYFERYLAALPDAPNRPDVEARIEVLRRAQSQPADPVDPPADSPADPVDEPADESVFSTWWFWTIVGVVVAGAAAGVLAVTLGADPDPIAGNEGVVHALGVPF